MKYRVNIVRLRLLFLLLLASANVYSQIPIPRIDKKDRLVTYSETYSSSLDREQLYINVKTWMFIHIDNQDGTFEIKSPSVYRAIGKKNVSYKTNRGRDISLDLSIQIDCKDHEFKYIVKILNYRYQKDKIDLTKLMNSDSKLLFNKSSSLRQWEIISNEIMFPLLNSIKESIGSSDEF